MCPLLTLRTFCGALPADVCKSKSIQILVTAILVAQACGCDTLQARLVDAAACQAAAGDGGIASALDKDVVAALGSGTLAELLLLSMAKYASSQPVPICEVLAGLRLGGAGRAATAGGAGAPPLAHMNGVPGLLGGKHSFRVTLCDFSRKSGVIESSWVEVRGVQWRLELLLWSGYLSGEGELPSASLAGLLAASLDASDCMRYSWAAVGSAQANE